MALLAQAQGEEQAADGIIANLEQLALTDEDQRMLATAQARVARAKAFRLARLLAVKETDLDEATFPEACPHSLAAVCDPGFYPS